MLDYYDLRNRVVKKGLSVYYSKELVFGNWVGETVVASAAKVYYASMWKYTRHATKSYRYVGMDLTTALECADYLNDYYHRTTSVSVWNSTAGTMGDWERLSGGYQLMAKVSIVASMQDAGSGGMFDVSVEVDELDIQMNKLNTSVSWISEDGREYDEE